MCNAAVPTSSCSIVYIYFVPAGQNRLLALNYIYPGEDPAVCAAHVEWGAAFQAQFAQDVLPEVTPAQRNTTPGRPLRVRRVGLVCNVCVVGAWLAAVFMHVMLVIHQLATSGLQEDGHQSRHQSRVLTAAASLDSCQIVLVAACATDG